MWENIKAWAASDAARDFLFNGLQTLGWLSIGLPAAFWLSGLADRTVRRSVGPQHGLIASKAVFLSAIAFIVVSVLLTWGFELAPLLGAAGVVGVAFGFAAQTSLSNLISGFFLLAEQPFVIGDVVKVGETTGEVLSIDLMSVKLRTFDNKFVRIPNETILKSEATNITRFPVRRVDLTIGVAYKEDITRVRTALMAVAARNPLCLMNPEPMIAMQGFGGSSVDLLFCVWALKGDFLTVKNGLLEEIKAKFDAEGIEIPYPHISLYAGSQTEPFPVRIVAAEAKPDGSAESYRPEGGAS